MQAQHWFDKGVAAGKALDWRTICSNGRRHLTQALSTLSSVEKASPSLVERIEETRRAMDLFFAKTTPDVLPIERDGYQKVVASLHDQDRRLRFMFDLAFDPASGTHHTASKSDDTYGARALTATLDLIALEAQSTLERVRSAKAPDEYQPLVMTALGRLGEQDALHTARDRTRTDPSDHPPTPRAAAPAPCTRASP